MLEARAIHHRYRRRLVISVDHMTLERGTATALVGPNGSGKSTLLRILAFVEPPTEGVLVLDGRPIVSRADRRIARRCVTLVEQQPFLFRGTVWSNCTYGLSLRHVRGGDGDRRALEALERLGILGLAGRDVSALSDGERQKVAVARALALRPDVMLLDEPVSAADRTSAAQLYRLLDDERRNGLTVGFASHQLEDAYRWSDRVLALADGRAAPATPENMFRVVLPEGDRGPPTVRLGDREVHVVTDKRGAVTVAIAPEDIVLSTKPFRSSARNQFEGRVIRVSDDGRGRVTVTVDAGVELTARITPGALQELALSPGATVYLSFKAVAVQVF